MGQKRSGSTKQGRKRGKQILYGIIKPRPNFRPVMTMVRRTFWGPNRINNQRGY